MSTTDSKTVLIGFCFLLLFLLIAVFIILAVLIPENSGFSWIGWVIAGLIMVIMYCVMVLIEKSQSASNPASNPTPVQNDIALIDL